MFKVRIVTPSGLYDEIDGVTLLNVVTTEGQRGILSNHMPIVLMLVVSKMTIVKDKERNEYAISNGLLYFEDNLATLLIDSIEHKSDIDVERALEAKDRAEQRLLKEANTDQQRAQIALEKAINRLKVAGK